jgi:multicomponent Na+:H+ antiporter subunit A
LRQYFFVVFSFFVLFAAAAIFSAGRPRWPAFAPAVDYPALAAAVLMAAAALRAATTDSRLTAVCSLGFIGASAALIFVLFGAPDVALTQLLVETLTLVIISFVLWRLPPLKRDPRPAWEKIAALTLSLAVGGLAAVLTLSTLSGDLDPKLTAYFAENSLKLAHGRNIVNVILVDFRALDTLGEIVVVAGAALSALILLRSGHRERRP